MKNIPIVYNLEDLKKIYDKESFGIKGMWCFHSGCHDGHKKCGEITRKNCDWVLGVYWNNLAAGLKLLTGVSKEIDYPILQTDIDELKKKCDVIMIFTGDYHPYVEHYDYLKHEFNKQFPPDLLKEKGIIQSNSLYGSLIYSTFVRIVIHEIYNIKIDFHTISAKDRWRFIGYDDWCEKRFGIKMNMIEPVETKLGNVVSSSFSSLPKNFQKRIDRKLLYPHFKTIEDVRNHIKDIKDLNVGDFNIEYGWIHCKFYFKNKRWWTVGIKCQ